MYTVAVRLEHNWKQWLTAALQ